MQMVTGVAAVVMGLAVVGVVRGAEPIGAGSVGGEVRDWRYVLTIQEIAAADDEERLGKLVGDNPDRILSRLSDGRTVVHVAGEAGALKSLRVLAKAGADLNVADNKGHTALMTAIGMHYSTTVKTLVELGADVNKQGTYAEGPVMPPLTLAMQLGHADIVATLLSAKVSFDQVGPDGQTPLTAGAGNGRLEAVKFALAHGATADVKNREGYTALQLAVRGGYNDVVKALIDAKADPNMALPGGGVPLIEAVRGRHEDVAETLLAAGAKVNAQDAGGTTALLVAAGQEDEGAVKMLLEKGADPKIADKQKRQALGLTKNPTLWALMVAKGADVDATVQGAGGGTALQQLIARGDAGLVKTWLTYKPNPMVPNREGLTAKELAARALESGGGTSAVVAERKEIAKVVEAYQEAYFAAHGE